MLNQAPQYDYYFKDKSTTMLLPMEKFEKWMQKNTRRKLLEKKAVLERKIEERTQKGLNTSVQRKKLREIVIPEVGDDDPRLHWEYDKDDPKFATDKDRQSFSDIFGSKNTWFVEGIGNLRFDKENKNALVGVEVLKFVDGEEAQKKRLGRHDKRIEKEENELKKHKLNPQKINIEVTKKAKAMTLDEWIILSCMLFRGIPSLVTALDMDIKRIAFNSGRYLQKGCSTVCQLESIIEMKEQKEMLLNIYVLNKNYLKARKVLKNYVKSNPTDKNNPRFKDYGALKLFL